MQDGALLGDVDLITGKHRVDMCAQAGFLSQPQQEAHRLVRNAMLRVVEVKARGLDREALATTRVLAEERAHMDVADLLVVILQRFPSGPSGERRGFRGHRLSPFSASPVPRFNSPS